MRKPITINSLMNRKKHGIFRKTLSIVLAIAVLHLSFSCSYFNVRNVPVEEGNIKEEIQRLNQTKNYALVHDYAGTTWHLNNMIINGDNYTISGTIKPISTRHIYEKPRQSKRVHKYNYGKKDPFNELHLYLKDVQRFEMGEEVTLSLADIYQISVNDKNTGRTLRDIGLWTGGIIVGTAIIFLIALALKSSCPFVYVKEGDSYAFVGELYPGQLTPNMQKDDFLPLPSLKKENGFYTMEITNELKEKQYTDLLELIQVDHNEDVQIMVDSKGELYTLSDLKNPQTVYIDRKLYSGDEICKKDGSLYSFDSKILNDSSTREMVLEFDTPINAQFAKLVLSAKNSFWLDFVYGKFNEQFGTYYNTFQKKQQSIPLDEINDWINGQNIPLSVYVKRNGMWEMVERLASVGPMATRDMVVPIPLDDFKEDKLHVKLETGFKFWEIDYLGIDFSAEQVYETTTIKPFTAIDHNGLDVSKKLSETDENYLAQEAIGDWVEVQYKIPEGNQYNKSTFFLKNRGYYNYIRNYQGEPNFAWLKSFREDGAFTKFSESTYFSILSKMEGEEVAYHE